MNIAIVSGNLTNTPELRHSDDKKAVARFTLVENTNPEKPEFIQCKVFGKVAEACEKYLNKGNKALVRGYYHSFNYTNKKGEKIYGSEIIATSVEFLTPKPKNQKEEDIPDDLPF